MRKILRISILFIILLVIVYQFRFTLFTQSLPVFNYLRDSIGIFSKLTPCTEPIPYTLGSFDTKFNISKSFFLDAIKEAETIWEKPFGRELFTYKEDAEDNNILKINLIYDYRQDATNKLASLGIVVKDNKTSYDALNVTFTELKAEFEAMKKNYDIHLQNFNMQKKVYEDKVEYWNARGGAPKKEYNELQGDKIELDAQVSRLQSLQTQMNEMIDEINAMVVVLNRLVNILNINVDQYNTVGASRGESFTEGVYYSDGSSRAIDIYEFSNRVKLVRVLAHEFGHALDLPHLDDPKAIMYRLNQGNSEVLTESDLGALTTRCGV